MPTFIAIKKHILDKRCISCHSPGGTASDVPLTSLREMLDSPREVVLPGNADESGLFLAVSRQDSRRMPPPENADPLNEEEIQVIWEWIDRGAPEK